MKAHKLSCIGQLPHIIYSVGPTVRHKACHIDNWKNLGHTYNLQTRHGVWP